MTKTKKTKKITMVVFRDELENVLDDMKGCCGVVEFEQMQTIKYSDHTQIIRSYKNMILKG